ncbi:hypothetical protein [Bradyrhizobium sp. USDA 10063]
MTARKTPKIPAAVGGDTNAAIASERLRISAILESAEGKRNPAMAQKLALYSTLDVDTAKSILAEAPAANPYLQAMDREGPVGLSAATLDVSNDPRAARLQEIKELGAIMRAENRRAQGLSPKKD